MHLTALLINSDPVTWQGRQVAVGRAAGLFEKGRWRPALLARLPCTGLCAGRACGRLEKPQSKDVVKPCPVFPSGLPHTLTSLTLSLIRSPIRPSRPHGGACRAGGPPGAQRLPEVSGSAPARRGAGQGQPGTSDFEGRLGIPSARLLMLPAPQNWSSERLRAPGVKATWP